MLVKFRLVAGSKAEADEFAARMAAKGAEVEQFEDATYLEKHYLKPDPASAQGLLSETTHEPFLNTEIELDDTETAEDEYWAPHDWGTVWIVECDKDPHEV